MDDDLRESQCICRGRGQLCRWLFSDQKAWKTTFPPKTPVSEGCHIKKHVIKTMHLRMPSRPWWASDFVLRRQQRHCRTAALSLSAVLAEHDWLQWAHSDQH